MIGTAGPVGSDPPKRRSEDYRRQQEKDTHDLEPDDAAHPTKWAQEAADTAHHSATGEAGYAPGSLRICSPGGSGPVQSIGSRGSRTGVCCGCLAGAGQSLAGDSAGDPKADSQRPTDVLSSHFVMMVAAAVHKMYFFG